MSQPITALFVGGPEDGRRMAIGHPQPGYVFAERPGPLPVYREDERNEKISFRTHQYVRLPLPLRHADVAVYIPRDWEQEYRDSVGIPDTTERAIRALIRGYVGEGERR